MKQLAKGLTLKTMLTFLMIAMLQMVVCAQEEGSGSGSSSTTTTTKSSSVSLSLRIGTHHHGFGLSEQPFSFYC